MTTLINVSSVVLCIALCLMAVSCMKPQNDKDYLIGEDALGYEWAVVFHSTQTGEILDMVAVDGNASWACTETGDICGPEDGKWKSHFCFNMGDIIGYASYQLDSNNVWIGAYSMPGKNRVAFFDGNRWSLQGNLDDEETYSLRLTDICGCDAEHVWASTMSTVFPEYSVVYFFDGISWRSQFVTDELSIYDLAVIDENHVWAIGSSEKKHAILFYDGERWVEQYNSDSNLVSIEKIDNNSVWATNEAGQVICYDEGAWTISANLGGSSVLKALDKEHVWAITDKTSTVYPIDNQTITFFNGNEWQEQLSPGCAITDLFPLDENHVWATLVKQNGQSSLFFYDGSKWIEQYTYDGEFESVKATNENDLLIQGLSRIYRASK